MLKALISHGTPTFMYDSAYKDECVNPTGLEPCPVPPAAARLAAAHLAAAHLTSSGCWITLIHSTRFYATCFQRHTPPQVDPPAAAGGEGMS